MNCLQFFLYIILKHKLARAYFLKHPAFLTALFSERTMP